jgi:CheY-like chemotaxis protein
MNPLPDSTKPARADTVLVLDDDVLVRMPICQYLRNCGYRVLEAARTSDKKGALAVARRRKR